MRSPGKSRTSHYKWSWSVAQVTSFSLVNWQSPCQPFDAFPPFKWPSCLFVFTENPYSSHSIYWHQQVKLYTCFVKPWVWWRQKIIITLFANAHFITIFPISDQPSLNHKLDQIGDCSWNQVYCFAQDTGKYFVYCTLSYRSIFIDSDVFFKCPFSSQFHFHFHADFHFSFGLKRDNWIWKSLTMSGKNLFQ